MSFGRKGMGPGGAAGAGVRPAMRLDPAAAEITARREAFVAAERERRAEPATENDPLAGLRNGPRPATRREVSVGESWNPISEDALRSARRGGGAIPRAATTRSYVLGEPRQRSLLLAYVFWYFCAPIGLHRIYCGSKETGLYQLALFFGGLILMLIWPPLGLMALGAWALWILADLFLMPGMMRRFKAEHAEYLDFV